MGVVGRLCLSIAVGATLVGALVIVGAPASAQTALLNVLSTHVTLAHPAGANDDVIAERIIRSGDTVVTDETGRAVVTYPDGSTALMEANSTLAIEFVQTGPGEYAVRMQQTIGRVWYAVTRAVALGSRYEVRSSGMASVIRAGTGSYVVVGPNGETTVTSTSGPADLATDTGDVSVPESPTSNESPNLPVADPVTRVPAPVRTPAPTPAPALSTPKPVAAPIPAPTPVKDKFGPRKDAPGQPPPKANASR